MSIEEKGEDYIAVLVEIAKMRRQDQYPPLDLVKRAQMLRQELRKQDPDFAETCEMMADGEIARWDLQ